MTIPLPNPLTTTETVLVGLLLLFFALWGWRHGLDAVDPVGAVRDPGGVARADLGALSGQDHQCAPRHGAVDYAAGNFRWTTGRR